MKLKLPPKELYKVDVGYSKNRLIDEFNKTTKKETIIKFCEKILRFNNILLPNISYSIDNDCSKRGLYYDNTIFVNDLNSLDIMHEYSHCIVSLNRGLDNHGLGFDFMGCGSNHHYEEEICCDNEYDACLVEHILFFNFLGCPPLDSTKIHILKSVIDEHNFDDGCIVNINPKWDKIKTLIGIAD